MTNSITHQDARSYRLSNIDMLRGFVIIIMALDHARDLLMISMAQDPMAQADIPLDIYITRWVTHFCAPVFVFLAGTSAGLMRSRKTKNELANFLLKRGLWLIFVEIVIISTAFTFSPFAGVPEVGGHTVIVLQVIWAIGASMIVLAGAQYLGTRACLLIGITILLGHNSLDSIWPSGNLFSGENPFWYGLHTWSSTRTGPILWAFGYPVIPWIGVMLLGFSTVNVFKASPKTRDKNLMKAGIAMTIMFLVIRATGLYGDPNPWQMHESLQSTILDFFNVTKYPPSLLFLLITLGSMAIFCAKADKITGRLKNTLVMFGRVPFAFYIAHFYLLRLFNMILASYQGFEPHEMMTLFFFLPKGYGVSIVGVYIGWMLTIVILYPFCKWVAEVKSRRKDWWLSYI